MKFAVTGQLYRGSKPVMWSVVERTALAEAEVEYQDYESDTIWVKFPVVAHRATMADVCAGPARRRLRRIVVIWTTTPWTIPGNRAITYLAAHRLRPLSRSTDAPRTTIGPQAGEKLIFADKLAEDVFAKAQGRAFESPARRVGATSLHAITLAPIRSQASAAATSSTCRCSTATMSPTTPAPASSIPRPAMAARTSSSGWTQHARCCEARHRHARSPSPSTTPASSPRTRRASDRRKAARASSTTTARRATPTRPSSTRWSSAARWSRAAG